MIFKLSKGLKKRGKERALEKSLVKAQKARLGHLRVDCVSGDRIHREKCVCLGELIGRHGFCSKREGASMLVVIVCLEKISDFVKLAQIYMFKDFPSGYFILFEWSDSSRHSPPS